MQHLSMDEILEMVSEIAKDQAAGADRFRALKFLRDQQSGTVVLPPPASNQERLDRLVRVMRASGMDLCQMAWRRIWPTTKRKVDDPPTRVQDMPLTQQEEKLIMKVTGLKQLYRMFPEVMRPTGGVPNGFPFRGKLVQMDWCRAQARKMLIDRKIAAAAKGEKVKFDDGTDLAGAPEDPREE